MLKTSDWPSFGDDFLPSNWAVLDQAVRADVLVQLNLLKALASRTFKSYGEMDRCFGDLIDEWTDDGDFQTEEQKVASLYFSVYSFFTHFSDNKSTEDHLQSILEGSTLLLIWTHHGINAASERRRSVNLTNSRKSRPNSRDVIRGLLVKKFSHYRVNQLSFKEACIAICNDGGDLSVTYDKTDDRYLVIFDDPNGDKVQKVYAIDGLRAIWSSSRHRDSQ